MTKGLALRIIITYMEGKPKTRRGEPSNKTPAQTPWYAGESLPRARILIPQRTQPLRKRLFFLLRRANLCLRRRSFLEILLQIYTSLVCRLRHQAVHVFLRRADGGRGGCDVLVYLGRGVDVLELLLKVDHDRSDLAQRQHIQTPTVYANPRKKRSDVPAPDSYSS